jgi:L-iditol 2-dehydrogenase
MRAVVVSSPNVFSVQDIDVPRPGPNELLCRVHRATICGTDVHIVQGEYPNFWPQEWPHILGHEWAGEVIALGQGSEALGWRPGDRVAGTSHAACGFCRKCVTGRYNLCENFGIKGLHSQYGHNAPGAFADYVVHSVKSVFRIPDAIGYDEAAMLDPAAIALHTVKRGRLEPGSTAVVIGAGVMGLLVAECARALGAGRVIVAGRGQRLVKAEELGNEVIDVTRLDMVDSIRSTTGGLGADVIYECSGDPNALGSAVEAARKGARIAVIGIPQLESSFPLRRLVLDEIEILGVRASAGEMAEIVPLVLAGMVRLQPLITHRFPLEDFSDAFSVFKNRTDGSLKVILSTGL